MQSVNNVIVIGPPRSGTSVVARLLQDNLGVMMDEGPIQKDEGNPLGYYEDHRVTNIFNGLISRWKMGKAQVNKIDPVWAIEFSKWVVYRSMKYKLCGFKEPRCVGVLGWVTQFFKDARWIVCDRSDEQIIKSQVDKTNVPNEQIAAIGLKAYRDLIKKNLKSYHLIDLTYRQNEDDLTDRLWTIING